MIVLVIALIVIIGAQTLLITMLNDQINKERKCSRHFIASLTNEVSTRDKQIEELKEELEDYKEAYNDCYTAYVTNHREKNIFKQQIEYYKDLHSRVVDNISLMITEGRIIKDKTVYPREVYQFSKMNEDDIKTLYGAPYLQLVK